MPDLHSTCPAVEQQVVHAYVLSAVHTIKLGCPCCPRHPALPTYYTLHGTGHTLCHTLLLLWPRLSPLPAVVEVSSSVAKAASC
jgi:hypothetical protein